MSVAKDSRAPLPVLRPLQKLKPLPASAVQIKQEFRLPRMLPVSKVQANSTLTPAATSSKRKRGDTSTSSSSSSTTPSKKVKQAAASGTQTSSVKAVLQKRKRRLEKAHKPAERKDIRTQITQKFQKLFNKPPVPKLAPKSQSSTTAKPSTTNTSATTGKQQQQQQQQQQVPTLRKPKLPTAGGRGSTLCNTFQKNSSSNVIETSVHDTALPQRQPPMELQTIVPPATVAAAASIYSAVAESSANRDCSELQDTQKTESASESGSGSSSDSDSDVEEARQKEKRKAARNGGSSVRNLVKGKKRTVKKPRINAKGALQNTPQPYTVRTVISTETVSDGGRHLVKSLERDLPEAMELLQRKAEEMEMKIEEEHVDNINPDTIIGSLEANGGVAPESAEALGVMRALSIRPYSRDNIMEAMKYWFTGIPCEELSRDLEYVTNMREKFRALVPLMYSEQMHKYNREVLAGDFYPVCRNAVDGSCEGLHMLHGKNNFAPRAFFYEDEEKVYLSGEKPWPRDRRCALCIMSYNAQLATLFRADHTSVPPKLTIQEYRVNGPECQEYLYSDTLTNPELFSIGLFDPIVRYARNMFKLVIEDGRRCYKSMYGIPGKDAETFF